MRARRVAGHVMPAALPAVAMAVCGVLAGLVLPGASAQAQGIGQVFGEGIGYVTGPEDPLAAPGTPQAAPTIARYPRKPTLNFYGAAGLIDMPSGEAQPDGEIDVGVSWFGGIGRYTLTMQALPWISASFRYNSFANANFAGFETYYDRGFDLRFRLMKETDRLPAVTLGLQDFVGTGISAGEYIAATKTFALPPSRLGPTGTLKVTGGMGWGRLGSYGSIGGIGDRPSYDPNSTGGQVAWDQWFRGPMAPFAGIEWQPNDRLGFKLEYSSDAYVTEVQDMGILDRRSPINLGVEYRVNNAIRIGGYYMYGSEIGFNIQIQANPKNPPVPVAIPAPQPVLVRQDPRTDPEAWSTSWAGSREASVNLRNNLTEALDPQGITLETFTASAHEAEVRYINRRYRPQMNGVGRVARTMAQLLPPSVETFHIVPMANGMAVNRITLRRSDLEVMEYETDATEGMTALIGYSDPPQLSPDAVRNPDLYPRFNYALQPYFEPSYFAPDKPIRLDVGIELNGAYRPAPGWIVGGALRYKLFGDLDGGRPSNSTLPHVRSDWAEYAKYEFTMRNLYAAKQWRPGKDLYARATFGYLEQMFGGVSTELLWKPVNSPLGLGVELNYVAQRDQDQLFGFGQYDYLVGTGHATAYYEFGPGLLAQVSAGRYLAGDIGGTFSIDRTFDNGWSVGAFFTITNVSAEQFGEGSFDKGIRFSMPVNWVLGQPSRQSVGTTITPITRDGGQMLNVPGRLYPQIRDAHRKALDDASVRFWQ